MVGIVEMMVVVVGAAKVGERLTGGEGGRGDETVPFPVVDEGMDLFVGGESSEGSQKLFKDFLGKRQIFKETCRYEKDLRIFC